MCERMRKIITITTDFGLKDEYAAAVKGVILSISPEAEIIDITHQVPKYNVRKGALILKSTVPYFPSGSIHLAVIDPGVGSERSILIIKTRSGKYLVGL
ncbi:MAG: SAM-dependent chlorinase/fluorinase, partial [Candidatus Odinarchaeota archaeon]